MVQQHDFWLTMGQLKGQISSPTIRSVPQKLIVHSPMEECALGPACWLWDYLRRSGVNESVHSFGGILGAAAL